MGLTRLQLIQKLNQDRFNEIKEEMKARKEFKKISLLKEEDLYESNELIESPAEALFLFLKSNQW